MTSKERFMAVIKGEQPDRTPVFPLLMGFAASRHGLKYSEFASNGTAMAEAQLRAAECFSLDAITACSDAFRICADLGAQLIFHDDKPPHAPEPLVRTAEDFKALKRPDVSNKKGRMYDRAKAVSEMVQAAGNKLMVLGWVDMPFAEACSVCGVQDFMFMLYDEPDLAKELLAFLTDIVIDFSLLQLEMGAPMIGAGDAAASLLSPELYREFALPFETVVCRAIHDKGGLVKLHICGNTSQLLDDMVSCGADLYNVDHMVDFRTAMQTYTAAGRSFKGNLNPVSDIFQSKPEEIYNKARALVQAAGGKKYMLSAGCEIPTTTSDENFMAFCRAAR